jgi:hypothetical protein
MAITRRCALAVGCMLAFLVGQKTAWHKGSVEHDLGSHGDSLVDASVTATRPSNSALSTVATKPPPRDAMAINKPLSKEVHQGRYSEFFFAAVDCQPRSHHSYKYNAAAVGPRGADATSAIARTPAALPDSVSWCSQLSGVEQEHRPSPRTESEGHRVRNRQTSAYFALKTTTATEAYVARTQSILDSWGRWCRGHVGIFTDMENNTANRRIACQLGSGGSVYEIPRVAAATRNQRGHDRAHPTRSPEQVRSEKTRMYFESQRRKLARVLALYVLNRTEEWLCYVDDDMHVVVPNLLEELRQGPCPTASQQNRCFVADQQDHTASGMPYSVGAFCMTRSIAVETHAAIASGGWTSGSDDVGFAHLVRRVARVNVTNSPRWISQYSKLVLGSSRRGPTALPGRGGTNRLGLDTTNQKPTRINRTVEYLVIKRYISKQLRVDHTLYPDFRVDHTLYPDFRVDHTLYPDFRSAPAVQDVEPYTTMSVLHVGSIFRDQALKKKLLARLEERQACH